MTTNKTVLLTPTQAQYLFHQVEDGGPDELQRIFEKANVFTRKTRLKITVGRESVLWLLNEAKSQIHYFSKFISEYQDEDLNEYWTEELKSYRYALVSLKNLLRKLTA